MLYVFARRRVNWIFVYGISLFHIIAHPSTANEVEIVFNIMNDNEKSIVNMPAECFITANDDLVKLLYDIWEY